MRLVNTVLIATTALFTTASLAAAAPSIGLAGDKTLVFFDTDNPAETRTLDVSGVDNLVGIDYRPANGTLVGVTRDSVVVTIDPTSGAATELSRMNTPLPMGETQVIVDFNPMADRLRYMTGTTNHRVNIDTGEVTVDGSLAYEDGDAGAEKGPAIAAAAYINSFGKPEATAMYDIESGSASLIRQTSPNDGTLKTIGSLGIAEPGDVYAFDVQTTEDGTNTAWLVNGNRLYTVNLETGAATEAGTIEGVDGDIRDITIMPAM